MVNTLLESIDEPSLIKYNGVPRGFLNRRDYNKYFARQRGFESYRAYERALERERQWTFKYILFSELLQGWINNLKITITQFASDVEISRQRVYMYLHAKGFPNQDRLRKICDVAQVSYEDLDDRLKK